MYGKSIENGGESVRVWVCVRGKGVGRSGEEGRVLEGGKVWGGGSPSIL